MKKITLLVASIFLIGGGVVNATEITKLSQERRLTVDFRNAEPIVFMERGVEFYVFPDGQFDFNTHPSAGDRYKQRRLGTANRTYDGPGNSRNRNYGVRVEHDNFGRVRQIGNVFISYDAKDRIKRIGSVYMSYNRFALTQVGGLQIIYNRRGQIVETVGTVKGGRAYQYNQNNNGNNDYEYGNNQNSGDQDDYYYKTNGTNVQRVDPKVVGSVDIRIGKRF
jgi:hypothetical protein